jgi:arginine/ornithine transport system substrate-binding protein
MPKPHQEKSMRRLLTFAAGLAFAMLAQATEAKDWDKIRFGVEGAYPPFSEVTPDGTLKGFDIDIAKALCEELKAECTLVAQDWDGIIPALLARKYDAIIASMSITDERKKVVDFTSKYYQTPARFVAKADAPTDVSKEGLKGKRVGVQRATIHDSFLTDNFGDSVEVVRYGTQDEANLDLVAGRVDLLLADSIVIQQGFLRTPEGKAFAQIGPTFSDPRWFGEGAGIAVRKQDEDLKAKLSEAIAAIRKNGKWEEIKQRYFGDLDIWGAETS